MPPRSCVSSQRSCVSSITTTAANNFNRKMGKTTLNPSHSTRLWAQLNYFYYILNHLPAHRPAHRLYPILLYHNFFTLSTFSANFLSNSFKFLTICRLFYLLYLYLYLPFYYNTIFSFCQIFPLIILFNYLLSFLLSFLPFYPASPHPFLTPSLHFPLYIFPLPPKYLTPYSFFLTPNSFFPPYIWNTLIIILLQLNT